MADSEDVEKIGRLRYINRYSPKQISIEYNYELDYVKECIKAFQRIIKVDHENDKEIKKESVLLGIDYIWTEANRTLELIKENFDEIIERDGVSFKLGDYTEESIIKLKKTQEVPKLLNTMLNCIEKRIKLEGLTESNKNQEDLLKDKVMVFNYIAPNPLNNNNSDSQ